MRVAWHISEADIARVRAVVAAQRDDPFVQLRVRRNVEHPPIAITREAFWKEMVDCILTTQQRSGPDAAVNRLAATRPYPLAYARVRESGDARNYAGAVLKGFGGIRFVNRIPDQLARNVEALASGLWDETHAVLAPLLVHEGQPAERTAATFLEEHFAGLGPKQARNVLQGLGLARYEIPLDSRVVRWLNDAGWPWKLTAGPLADRDYYAFVLDGVQALCAEAEVLPCTFDAAVFTSYDSKQKP